MVIPVINKTNAKNIAISETGIIMLLFIKLIALFIFSNMTEHCQVLNGIVLLKLKRSFENG